MADGTDSTAFIVGMVFFAIGVILLVVIIIVVMYVCIYRRRKKRYEKKKFSTTNSIVYTKSLPPLDTKLAGSINGGDNHIQTVTTMSPLEPQKNVFTLENGSVREGRDNFLLTTAGDSKLNHSLDTVDNKYIVREVYAVPQKKKKTEKRTFSSSSWGGSLLGTKKKKQNRYARSEMGYRTAYVNPSHSGTLDRQRYYKAYGSTPTLVRLEPVKMATMPRHASSDRRVYLLDDNTLKPLSSQSLIMSNSPPRSPRSPRFQVARSLDGFNDDDYHFRSHNTSRDHSPAYDSPDGNFMQWSPSMRQQLEEKDKLEALRSNSDLSSVSRSGRKKGVGEHKYIYNVQDASLTQF